MKYLFERGYHLMSNPQHVQAALIITNKDYAVVTLNLNLIRALFKGVTYIVEKRLKQHSLFDIGIEHRLKTCASTTYDEILFGSKSYQ